MSPSTPMLLVVLLPLLLEPPLAPAPVLVEVNPPSVPAAHATTIRKTTRSPKDLIQLHLKVKADSRYKDDYTSVDFWIDKELSLPAKIKAVSVEEDIYEIRFLEPKVNKKINNKIFEFKVPKGFNEPEIIKLKK